ncbi:type IX secretion system outer membrane channel protein PorV [Pedobacter petrophilus]|uniref:Type IX secretion system outer membrane channel protein PorV n=1 Tax=Pedobacter petrophilus TaxID=1908241 RepID=A0A7K0FT82_9SPHI|nr:type IX secretion system outer membrane channel protein PorV [Pedobacter petrophilus]MRX74470.1 type IX secretion system outer membrane channel protein PorV [Pedobacter petrophilus]
MKIIYAYFYSRIVCIIIACTLFSATADAQNVQPGVKANGSGNSNIITAVPFLLITPDARAGAMGDAGVAVQPDANAMSINPSKLAFLEPDLGVAVSYSPWLRSLVPNVHLGYISGYYKPNRNSAVGMSLRYLSYGAIEINDVNFQQLGTSNPNEMAVDFTYAKRYGDHFSLGTAVRYIYSNLLSGQFVAGQQTKPGQALAADVSAYYKTPTVLFGRDAIVSGGIDISNIGTKMSYAAESASYFLPANLKIGAAATFLMDDDNQLTFALDINKLLVPTQPVYDRNNVIIAGKDPNRSVPASIFSSFNDAPGGASEELKELSYATGIEYAYRRKFALRAGYFYENPEKGNRRYATAGVGLTYESFQLNFAYVIAAVQKNPLANTLRFSLHYNFGQ